MKRKGVVLNASNSSITYTGGGTTGALGASGYEGQRARKEHTQRSDWQALQFIGGVTIPEGGVRTLGVGETAMSKTDFGYIYHINAPRPQATTIESLTQFAGGILKMLEKASSDGMLIFVLVPAGTGIYGNFFAYKGLIVGVETFLAKYPNTRLKIVLLNWEPAVFKNVVPG